MGPEEAFERYWGALFRRQERDMGSSDAFEIVSPQPLRAAYLAAEGAERGRATDRLILNYLPGNRTWVSGAVISDYQALRLPRKSDAAFGSRASCIGGLS